MEEKFRGWSLLWGSSEIYLKNRSSAMKIVNIILKSKVLSASLSHNLVEGNSVWVGGRGGSLRKKHYLKFFSSLYLWKIRKFYGGVVYILSHNFYLEWGTWFIGTQLWGGCTRSIRGKWRVQKLGNNFYNKINLEKCRHKLVESRGENCCHYCILKFDPLKVSACIFESYTLFLIDWFLWECFI